MKLTVLVDNNTLIDRYFLGEPGVSYFIQADNQEFLFDVGYSDAFVINARKMGINLLNVGTVVLSHGHLDHTWGLSSLIELYAEARFEHVDVHQPALVAHPMALATKTLGDVTEIGTMIAEEKLSRHFDLRLSKEPIWLTDKLVFLGEIERQNDFEAQVPIGQVVINGSEKDDYIMDDTALAYKASRGIVVITGCSHAGICNIVECAKKVCGSDRIVDIVGGFHLQDPSERQLQGTLEYMRKLQPEAVHACHCTDLNSKIALSRVVNIKEVGVGLTLEVA
jgi:7,8-dihydropterin-6-yl-methyl-4-(beta-D-ribofuranosyl)aminobenzene 5'-phosphate synthase